MLYRGWSTIGCAVQCTVYSFFYSVCWDTVLAQLFVAGDLGLPAFNSASAALSDTSCSVLVFWRTPVGGHGLLYCVPPALLLQFGLL
jgi:hypothetical protein